MSFEDNVKLSFQKTKEDAEGIKDELAFALKRIAHLENLLNQRELIEVSSELKKSKKKKK